MVSIPLAHRHGVSAQLSCFPLLGTQARCRFRASAGRLRHVASHSVSGTGSSAAVTDRVLPSSRERPQETLRSALETDRDSEPAAFTNTSQGQSYFCRLPQFLAFRRLEAPSADMHSVRPAPDSGPAALRFRNENVRVCRGPRHGRGFSVS